MSKEKIKYRIVLMVVLALLLQIVGPVAETVYGEVMGSRAFTFEIVRQEDDSGRYEWKYNPEKAKGKTEFTVDLKLKLTAEFTDLLLDSTTGEEIGEFTISKDGILTARIYEVEEELEPKEIPEEPEEEEDHKAEITDIVVEIDEDGKVTITAKVTGVEEDDKAKIEILNEEDEVVAEIEEAEITEEQLIAEFDDLGPGKYYAKITVGELSKVSEEFQLAEIDEAEEVEDDEVEEVEEAEEIEVEEIDEGEEIEIDVEKELDDEVDDEEFAEDDGENGEEVASEPEEDLEDEEVTFFGKSVATLAAAWDNLENLFLAQAEPEEEPQEPSSGGGVIPFGFMMPLGGDGDLSTIDGFTYESSLYLGSEEEPVADGSVIELKDLSLLTYRVEFTIPDDHILGHGDYLNLSLDSLTNVKGIVLDGSEKNLAGRIKFKVDGNEIDAALYMVEDNQLKIEFDNVDGLMGKKGRVGYVEIGFNIEEVADEVDVLEKIELVGSESKTFYILRHYDDAESITKDGSYNQNSDKITWIVDINKDLQDLEDASLEDLIPEGLIVESVGKADLTLKVKDNKTEIVEGTYSPQGYTTDDNKITISLGSLNRAAKRIKIVTGFASSAGGNLTFTNSATLKSSEEEYNDDKKLDFSRVTGITKSGGVSGGNKITWKIEFRGDNTGDSYDLIDTPSLPEGIGLVLVNGSIKLNNSTSHSIETELDDGKFKFTDIPNNPNLQTLEYTTEVIYKNDSAGGPYSIKNETNYNGNTASYEVEITRGEFLAKDNGTVRGSGNETYVDWEIKINSNEESWTNVEIWEYIPEGFKFIGASVDTGIVGVYKEDGEPKILEDDSGNEYIKLNVKGSELEARIKNKKVITVTTKLTDPTKIIDGVTKNKAKVSWRPDISGGTGIGIGDIDDYSLDVEGTFTKTDFTHTLSKKNTFINYNEQKTSWEVEYTTYETSIKGLQIVDELQDVIGDHKYDRASLKLNLNGTSYDLSSSEGNNLAVTKDGKTLEYNLNFEGDTKFTLTINSGNINDYYNHVTLTYDTTFDLSEMDDVDTGNNQLKNKVKITNNGSDLEKSSTKNIEAYISKNGKKDVEKETGNNRIFNWTVELNHKGKTIGTDKTIVDTLTGKQQYVDGSIEIYKAELQNNGTLSQGDELTSWTKTIVKVEKDNDDKDLLDPYHSGMTITFTENITTPLIVKYQTKAVGISEGEYKNNVAYNGQVYPKNIRYSKHSQFISKELLNSRNNKVVKGDVLKWELKINTSLSQIHEFEVKDKMSDGLVFIGDSLSVKDGAIDATPDFILSPLESPDNGFTLTKDYIDSEYTIEYETLVIADTIIGNISNDVYLSGSGFTHNKVGSSSYQVISRSAAGGSGYSGADEYKITINKVDIDEETITSSRAKFKLITETNIGTGEPIITEEELETQNGKATIHLEKNNYNSYFLEELEAPTGYVKSNERIEIELEDIKDIELKIVNSSETQVTGEKKWINGPDDKPAIELQLYRDNISLGDDYKVKLTGNEDTPWTYTWTNLEKTDDTGNIYTYIVKEVDVPENYQKEESGLMVTNTYIIPKTDVTAEKKWVGGEYARPDTVELQLYRNEVSLGDDYKIQLTGNEEIPWVYTWKDLDRTDIVGKEYTYTVKETDVPENYQKEESGLIVTNTYISPKTEVTGRKTWIGGPDTKPDIKLQLYRNGEAYQALVALKDGQTEYTWENLDKTDPQGVDYKYTIDEEEVTDYGKSISTDGLTITNTYKSPVSDVLGHKNWENGQYNRPDAIYLQLFRKVGEGVESKVGSPVKLDKETYQYNWKDQPINDNNGERYTYFIKEVDHDGNDYTPENYEKSEDGLTITNTYVIPKTNITATKVWSGGSSNKPTIELQLYRQLEGEDKEAVGDSVELKDGETEHTWEDLDATDEDGNEYTYTVDEVSVPTRYRKSISVDGLTITNTYSPPYTPPSGGGGTPPPKEEEPEEPTEPEQPEEPEEPEEPEKPTEPEKPDEPKKPFSFLIFEDPEEDPEGDPEDRPIVKQIIETPVIFREPGDEDNPSNRIRYNPKTKRIEVDDLEDDEEVEVIVTTTIEDEEIVVGKLKIRKGKDGEPVIEEELIDPYGTIRDSETNDPVGDVELKIYFADTPRNRENGRTPGTLVNLPVVPGFTPNDNRNPQISVHELVWSDETGDHGNYAWLVFPKTDYYIVAKRTGYEDYTSPTISVEYDIIKHDITMLSTDGDGTLPKTGEGSHLPFYIIGLVMIVLGYMTRKRKIA